MHFFQHCTSSNTNNALLPTLWQVMSEEVAREEAAKALASERIDELVKEVSRTPYTPNPTPYTLHPAPYTPNPTPYILHPTP